MVEGSGLNVEPGNDGGEQRKRDQTISNSIR